MFRKFPLPCITPTRHSQVSNPSGPPTMERHPSKPASMNTAHFSNDDIDTQADNIIKEEIHAHGNHIIDEDQDLDSRAECLLLLVWRLMDLLNQDRSLAWEQSYRIRDLTEEVQRLKDALSDSIPLVDRANPPFKPRTALEVAYEWREKGLERHLAERLRENWELQYRCKDLQEHVWRLDMQLRDSVSLGDVERPPWKPKTALERALEKKILELDGRIRNPKGRGRSNTI